ncbi:MAG: hypothetical protein K8S15_06350 [Candidatus Aegiribacteria sp.]|nr:hypothetical protein [Candidatus Aegiribacteria sp.]
MKAEVTGFILISVLTLLLWGISDAVDTPEAISYLPTENLEQFIVDRLDLTTFRNSIGPARSPGMRHFSDMGLSPTEISEGSIVFETENWYYCIEVLEREDVNSDGIEDLLIRFTDDSIEGTYLTEYVYLLVCLSEESDLIAVAYGPSGYIAERDPVMSEGLVVPWSEQIRTGIR